MEMPLKSFDLQDTEFGQINAELEIKQMLKNLKLEVKPQNGMTRKTIRKVKLCLGANQILQRRSAHHY
ncbi:unnamed protein product (macronuclear) [Paramecium tetraurelia]|uniref:Uncharacterized protein n=1 Tax=Paramecium tetraurelia TaxID=5888 RepID=A0BEW5_PARTE|nr:uncharacterized protein GSPATT00028116001 [Paramecium tetraurelia]CAK57082.1 unnamed protein product [Paramecium tetraurelia]|eukprot:XP_001424480.1 hypothetical protein (macronuclear) [Paramecium tetraurelia strain d4-2]